MYWSNYHSHCIFCDGRSSMEDFVRFAVAKDVRKYGFSSHAPLPFFTSWNMDLDDLSNYQIEFNRLKQKYSSRVALYMGLEVDYIHDFFEIKNKLYSTKDFDYLIGAIHYMDRLPTGEFWCVDGNFDDFEHGLNQLFDGDIRAAVTRFFEITTFMIQKGGFDIVGHLDKIVFNASKCDGFSITDSWYKNLVGDVLQLIKDKKLILEINTKSLNGNGYTYPDMQFYPLINELQIPIVVNSDCHYPTNIVDGFEKTFVALKKAGFTTMHQLVAGKWKAVEFCEKGILV